MLIILSVLAVLCAIGGICMMVFGDIDTGGLGAAIFVISAIALFALVIFLCGFTNDILESRVIDQKIEMYQEENANIESDLDVLVETYMDHEQKVMWAAEGGSPVTLVNLYPDLKSDALVQKQIDIYVENNNKIKELKESKLNVSAAKWWLYFGG